MTLRRHPNRLRNKVGSWTGPAHYSWTNMVTQQLWCLVSNILLMLSVHRVWNEKRMILESKMLKPNFKQCWWQKFPPSSYSSSSSCFSILKWMLSYLGVNKQETRRAYLLIGAVLALVTIKYQFKTHALREDAIRPPNKVATDCLKIE